MLDCFILLYYIITLSLRLFIIISNRYTKLAGVLSSRGVKSNPYTTFTVEDVKCEIDNVLQIAKQKKPYLESLIAFKKYKGGSRFRCP